MFWHLTFTVWWSTCQGCTLKGKFKFPLPETINCLCFLVFGRNACPHSCSVSQYNLAWASSGLVHGFSTGVSSHGWLPYYVQKAVSLYSTNCPCAYSTSALLFCHDCWVICGILWQRYFSYGWEFNGPLTSVPRTLLVLCVSHGSWWIYWSRHKMINHLISV